MAEYVAEDMNGRIDMILDGGAVGIGLESTIVDVSGPEPIILRPGYVTQEMLEKVLGEVELDQTILDGTTAQRPKAPGMKYRHYAPKGELSIVEGSAEAVVEHINGLCARAAAEGKKTGVIATEAIAHSLYRILREFDDEEVEVMYTESFSSYGMGQAIMNRLLKAAGHRIITV